MTRFLSTILGRLLRRAATDEEAESLMADFYDELEERVARSGPVRSLGWALAQIALSAFAILWHHFQWSLTMLANYLRTAFRILNRNKGYSAINVLGLSLGIASCIFILFWVQDELSFDRFHRNADRLYLVESEMHYGGEAHIWEVTPAQLAPALAQDFPEIAASVRMKSRYRTRVQWGQKSFVENGFYCVSPSFFSMFDFPLLSGQVEALVHDPMTLMISQRAAKKYFGEASPLGQVVQINQKLAFTVKGVFENFPANSHLQMDFIAPFSALESMGERLGRWGRFDFLTYVLVHDGVTAQMVQGKMGDYLMKHRPEAAHPLIFTPMPRIHLYSPNGTGNILYVRLFTLIGIVVLLVACINFVNLATARATLRGREVGVRKVVGASRKNLIRQLLGESFLLAFIAFIAALILALLLLPAFNALSGKHLGFDRVIQPQILLGFFGIVTAAGLFSGIYPAVYLSAFHPLKTLRQGRGGSSSAGKNLRKVLVVVQFTLSIALVIGTLVVGSQIRYIRHKDLGFDKENLIYVSLNRQSRKNIDRLKNELDHQPGILKIAASNFVPVDQGNFGTINRWDGNAENRHVMFHGMSADIDYFDLMGMSLVEGRGFSAERSELDIVINQEAARQMGLTNPVGVQMSYWGDTGGDAGRIVGVVKDFHFKPLRDPIMPLFISFEPQECNKLLFRIQAGQIPQALKAIEAAFKRAAPDAPFAYHFLDQSIDAMYRTEVRTGGILKALTVLVVLTSCMGLFGLAAFTAQRRTKEIGIRKTLGASVPGISLLLASEFVRLVVLANVLAWPLGYLVMRRWLQNFSYKITLNPWYFVGSALVALVIAVVTVSAQSVKAALSNPVESLKIE